MQRQLCSLEFREVYDDQFVELTGYCLPLNKGLSKNYVDKWWGGWVHLIWLRLDYDRGGSEKYNQALIKLFRMEIKKGT